MLRANLNKNWTTHIGILTKVLLASKNNIVELGAGPFSTPLLHWIGKEMNRKVSTYESNKEFYKYAWQFRSKDHNIHYVKDWGKVEFKNRVGVIFVDHVDKKQKIKDAIRLKDSADYIVVNSASDEKDYESLFKNFKQSYIWKKSQPYVAVFSNYKNLNNLKG